MKSVSVQISGTSLSFIFLGRRSVAFSQICKGHERRFTFQPWICATLLLLVEAKDQLRHGFSLCHSFNRRMVVKCIENLNQNKYSTRGEMTARRLLNFWLYKHKQTLSFRSPIVIMIKL